jgi:hypothetical protein
MSGMLERYQLGNGERYRADEGSAPSRDGVRRVA